MQRSLRFFVLICVLLVVATSAANLSCSSVEGGVVNGRLKECPDSPNCVCSHDARDDAAIEPLDLGPDVNAGWSTLIGLVEAWPRTEIETRRDDYVHAVCVSMLLRFRDDLELLLDREAGVAHVRSASRLGYSDFGANRKRVELLRADLAAALAGAPAD